MTSEKVLIKPVSRLVLLATLALLIGCAGQQKRAVSSPLSMSAVSLSSYRQPSPGLFTGGQPEAAEWSGLAAAGVTTVINLRTEGEMDGRDEKASVTSHGMHYVNIPVAGAAGVTAANADRLWQAIKDEQGPVLVHCVSGNRVGALLALGAQRHGGMSAVAALDYGKSAGLTRLEPVVRERLGLDAGE